MGRVIIFVYGVVCYLIFLVSCLYAVGFVGDIIVPKSIDSGAAAPFGWALLINAILLGLFAVQHSVMARPAFKNRWTMIIPRPAERSTYVLLSSLLLLLLYWQWRPMPHVVWSIENPTDRIIVTALFWIGWTVVIASTFFINHLDFFGLRQVLMHLRGEPYTEIGFKTPVLYKCVRHPIMLGFIIAFWAAPLMTAGHLVFAAATTCYILIALRFEEHDLMKAYGEAYKEYKSHVSMLIPLPPSWRQESSSSAISRQPSSEKKVTR